MVNVELRFRLSLHLSTESSDELNLIKSNPHEHLYSAFPPDSICASYILKTLPNDERRLPFFLRMEVGSMLGLFSHCIKLALGRKSYWKDELGKEGSSSAKDLRRGTALRINSHTLSWYQVKLINKSIPQASFRINRRKAFTRCSYASFPRRLLNWKFRAKVSRSKSKNISVWIPEHRYWIEFVPFPYCGERTTSRRIHFIRWKTGEMQAFTTSVVNACMQSMEAFHASHRSPSIEFNTKTA